MTDSPNEKKFMREKIVKPPINKRRLAGRILCLCLFAVILGVVAAVSFVVSMPVVEKFLMMAVAAVAAFLLGRLGL